MRSIHSLWLFVTILILCISLIPARPVAAAAYVVNSLDSGGNGVCDAVCTLYDAITEANNNPDADTITFNVNGTITLTSDLPAITGTLTIIGNGTGNTIISGNNARRVITQSSGSLTLQALTVRDGNAADYGGGLLALGPVTLNNVAFINNSATEAGAVLADNTITINASVFNSNTATNRGGALFINQPGTHNIVNSLFVNNTADNYGGAINQTDGTLTILNSTFSDNTASTGTVSASNSGTTVILRNSIVANTVG
jgi:predicted outer membrane repeat protein